MSLILKSYIWTYHKSCQPVQKFYCKANHYFRFDTRLKTSFIYQLKNSIKEFCHKHGCSFIDKSNVSSENLWKDGFHLNNLGKSVLLDNYVVTLNDSYFLSVKTL